MDPGAGGHLDVGHLVNTQEAPRSLYMRKKDIWEW